MIVVDILTLTCHNKQISIFLMFDYVLFCGCCCFIFLADDLSNDLWWDKNWQKNWIESRMSKANFCSVRVIIFLIKLYGHETNDQCKVKSDQLLIDLNQIKNKHSNNSLRCDIAKHMPHRNAILFVLLLFPSINGKNT